MLGSLSHNSGAAREGNTCRAAAGEQSAEAAVGVSPMGCPLCVTSAEGLRDVRNRVSESKGEPHVPHTSLVSYRCRSRVAHPRHRLSDAILSP